MTGQKTPSTNPLTSAFASLQQWARRSIFLKLGMLGFVSLLLLLPLSLVGSLTNERMSRKAKVVSEIAQQWSRAQVLTGPILNIPYKEHYTDGKGKHYTTTHTAHFLPHELSIEGELQPHSRYRGIYKAIVYRAKLRIKGRFRRPSFAHWDVAERDIQWSKAYVSYGLSDVKGIARKMTMRWAGAQVEFGPGIRNFDLVRTGVSSFVPVSQQPKAYSFDLTLELKGTESLQFLPLGKETRVKLRSSWSSPSFNGAFLPTSRTLGAKGFEATWQVFDMNRNFPQRWRNKTYNVSGSSFGVKLYQGNEAHQKSHRLQKYSLVFLACIILLLFFVETLAQERLHVLHYGLFGLGLCIFYLLQLALAEHLGFNLSYVLAALVGVALLFAYARWVCQSKGVSWLTAAIAGGLHLLFFAMLQLEDYALLLGSGVSVMVLAVVMNLSSRLRLQEADLQPQEGALDVAEARGKIRS